MSSKLGKISKKQWIKGLLVALSGSVVGAVTAGLQSGMKLDKQFWITTGTGAIVAVLGYINATLLTGENGNPLTNK
jgi:hypothetical protein